MIPILTAVASTTLFAGTVGVLIAVAGFGVLRMCESMMEAIGVLPLRWGEENVFFMMTISGTLAVPVIVWFAWWFYRQALKGERDLIGYRYTPPKSGPES